MTWQNRPSSRDPRRDDRTKTLQGYGAEEAARELGVKLLWDGPTETDAARQNEVVEAWITRGVNVIAVSVENREGLSTVLRKARGRGIKVLTFASSFEAGRLKTLRVEGDNILLGTPFTFTKDNVDRFDF